jgi:hypothetical protein
MDADKQFAEAAVAQGRLKPKDIDTLRRAQDAMDQLGEHQSLPLVAVRMRFLTPGQVQEILKT